MKNEHWEYKIGGSLQGLIPLLVLLTVFGGISIWLHIIKNGVFLFTSFFSVLLLALLAYSIYRFLFVKVLIGKDGFFHQTKPGNGKYYDYSEISKAWENQNGTTGYYCNYKTVKGQIVKFPFSLFESDGIDYFLTRINGEDNELNGDKTYE